MSPRKLSPTSISPQSVVALAGGVGAARFLRGLVRVVPADRVTAIVNTGDDREFYGVWVSPDERNRGNGFRPVLAPSSAVQVKR